MIAALLIVVRTVPKLVDQRRSHVARTRGASDGKFFTVRRVLSFRTNNVLSSMWHVGVRLEMLGQARA